MLEDMLEDMAEDMAIVKIIPAEDPNNDYTPRTSFLFHMLLHSELHPKTMHTNVILFVWYSILEKY